MVSTAEKEKHNAALGAMKLVRDGMSLGLGTGSTVKYLIEELGRKISEGWTIYCVPTSVESGRLAESVGIRIIEDIDVKLDLAIDGADEVDQKGNLIKGGGGALTREKIVAFNSKKFCVIIDSSKYHPEGLGKFRVPLEVLPFMIKSTARTVSEMGAKVTFRNEGKFVTDNGNRIIDADFGIIKDPKTLERKLKMIPGILEVGIFCSMTDTVIMGTESGSETIYGK